MKKLMVGLGLCFVCLSLQAANFLRVDLEKEGQVLKTWRVNLDEKKEGQLYTMASRNLISLDECHDLDPTFSFVYAEKEQQLKGSYLLEVVAKGDCTLNERLKLRRYSRYHHDMMLDMRQTNAMARDTVPLTRNGKEMMDIILRIE